jgi:outer membrane protein assembly factor BamB
MSHYRLSNICILTITLFLVGCSTLTELRLDLADKVFGREPPNPPAELKEIVPSKTVKIVWSSQLGKTERYDYTPALEAGFVYAVNTQGDLVKLGAENGRQEWRVNADEAISGGVGVGGGLVLVGTNRGNVLAYDVSGKLVWKSQLSSEVLSAPRYFDGMVIARSGDNRIYGLDAVDGSRKWVYERKVPALSLRSTAGIVVDGGAVYAGFSGGKMAAVRADNGKLLWEATVAVPKGVTEIERIADITSLPVVAGPVVYAVAYQGRIAAVDRVNGKVLWNRQISSYSGIDFENEKIYVSHALGSVYSLDYATGRTFWRQGDLLNRRLTRPVATSEFIAVGDLEGYVHFIDLDDGKFVSRIKIDSEPVMALIYGSSSSQVIAATRNGGLYALSVEGNAISKSSVTNLRESTAEPETSETRGEALEIDSVDSDGEEDTPRSILFKKDSMLLPDSEVEPAPGIILPKSQ